MRTRSSPRPRASPSAQSKKESHRPGAATSSASSPPSTTMSPYPTTRPSSSRTRSHSGLSELLPSHDRISSASSRRASPNASMNSSATRSASPARNSRSSAIELLLVHHPPEHGLHPRPLVQLEGAGLSLGVDAESDVPLTPLPEA